MGWRGLRSVDSCFSQAELRGIFPHWKWMSMTNASADSQPGAWEYHAVAKVGDLAENSGQSVPLKGTVIGLFLSGNTYYAISDFCPHQGASLSGGYVEEGLVMCPWHAWKFRLSDGAWADSLKSPIRCASYPVRVVGDTIEIGLPVTPS